MSKRAIQIIIVLAVALIAALVYIFVNNKRAEAPSAQNTGTPTRPAEQKGNEDEGDVAVEPDINTQEFKLTGSNVSCSTNTVNGATSRSCSGNIRVIPRAQADMEPGLYKINEQTKLLHNGQEKDINSLQQLSQAQTIVTLKLAGGSADTLAEIRY